MNTVFKHIKRCFTIYSALFITLFTTRIRGHTNCGPEQLVHCSKPLSILTDSGTGMSFVSSKADLDKICPDLKSALRCIHEYTRMCMNLQHRRHFKKLFHGTGAVVQELCNNGTFQNEYLTYTPCMKQVAEENDQCFSRYADAMKEIQNKSDMGTSAPQSASGESTGESVISYQKRKRETADEGIKNVCCSFQEYMECSTHATRRTCGSAAADFSRKFLDRMSASMISLHCSSYGSDECHLAMSSAHSLTSSAISWMTVTLPLALLSLRYLFASCSSSS